MILPNVNCVYYGKHGICESDRNRTKFTFRFFRWCLNFQFKRECCFVEEFNKDILNNSCNVDCGLRRSAYSRYQPVRFTGRIIDEDIFIGVKKFLSRFEKDNEK